MTGWADSNRRTQLPSDWAERKARVHARDRHTCQLCGGELCGNVNLECHHVGDPNDHDDTNLVTAGAWCHAQETQRQAAAGRRARPRPTRNRPTPRHPGLT